MSKFNSIHHAWSVLCSKSVIDGDSNVISLFDVFEQVDVGIEVKGKADIKQNISVPINYEIVSLWFRDDPAKEVHFTYKLELKDPEKKLLNELEQSVTIPVQKRRTRTRVKVRGLPVTEKGIYMFEVYLKKRDQKGYTKVASLPLQLGIREGKPQTKKVKN